MAAGTPAPRYAAVDVDRRLRRVGTGGDFLDGEGGRDDVVLEADDIPPRMYEDGKTVLGGEALGSSGEQLQMRGMPVNYFGNNRVLYRPSLNADTTAQVVLSLANIQDNRSGLIAGLTVKPGGLEIEMGGKEGDGFDFRFDNFAAFTPSLVSIPGRANSGTLQGYDLGLDFGRPAASPQGNAEHYWEAALMPTDRQVTAAGGGTGWLKDGDRTLPLGVYEVRLSNHIGLDRNSEDPDADGYETFDDQNIYLTYAAYGFMDFYRPGTTDATPSDAHQSHRVFPFHVGYDAFKDEARMRTTDIGDAAVTSGRFKGRTMAVRFQLQSRGPINATPEVVTRMRGDIELTATISGTQASNTIAGSISNMQDWDPKGYWKASEIIPPATPIRFGTDGTIGADGGFTGTFANYPTGYTLGGYRGNFYGPKESLEAAGTWMMQPPTTGSGNKTAIAGSFGAAMVREDGAYGRPFPAVPPTEPPDSAGD